MAIADGTAAVDAVEKAVREPKRIKARRLARELGQRVFRLYRSEWGMEIEACHRAGQVEVHRSGHLHSHPTVRCDHARLCPYCAAHDAGERVRRYLPVAEEAAKKYRLQFVTLTTLSCGDGLLDAGEDSFWEWWTKLRRRTSWRAVKGATISVETTYSETHGWHIHGHALIAVAWDENFSWRAVQADWEEISGASIVDFETIEQGDELRLQKSLRELLKYPAKLARSKRRPRPSEIASGACTEGDLITVDGLLEWPDHAFLEYCQWSTGARTLRSYGVFYNPPKPAEKEAPEDDPVVATVGWSWERGARDAEALLVFLIQGHKSTDGPGDPEESWARTG